MLREFQHRLSGLNASWSLLPAGSDGWPVLLLLDDLHWANDASLDALSKLLKALQWPELALLGARPGGIGGPHSRHIATWRDGC